MKPLAKTFVFILFITDALIAQSAYLTVQHPQQTWRYGTGTIEQAVYSVHPKGYCAEVSLYLTFSGRGVFSSHADSVEIVYNFDLPQGSIVTDLWLWVGDTIMRGYILDRWTASGIYESIVKRRKDPALLMQNSTDNYILRVYPLAGDEERRVKITYLARNTWGLRQSITSLPTYLLRATRYALPKASVLYFPAYGWTNPQLLEMPDSSMQPRYEPAVGPYYEATPMSSQITSNSAFSLSLTHPFRDGLFVQHLPTGAAGYYQVGIIPSQALDLKTGRSFAMCVDYDPTKSSTTAALLLSQIKTFLQTSLAPTDSFNLFFSNLTIQPVGSQWFKGDSIGIAQAFQLAGANPISSYSNMPTLLASAIDWIKIHGNSASIWLIANSDQAGDYQVANPLINDLMARMPKPIPVHITDFATTGWRYFYINGVQYTGNGYFHDNISRLTKGSTRRIGSESFASSLQKTFAALRGTIDAFDLYTTLASGFCFGRMTPGFTALQPVPIDQPVFQIGQYNGSFPFRLEFSGRYRDTLFTRQIMINEFESQVGNVTTSQVWTGMYIKSLEAQPRTNEISSQILALSLNQRLLSTVSAFLALEPSDTAKACLTCMDESKYTGIVEQPRREGALDSILSAYPNPFNSHTMLRVHIPSQVLIREARLAIYNVLGQLVRTLDISQLEPGSTHTIAWDGTSDDRRTVTSGIYVAVFATSTIRATTKLVLLK